MSVPASAALEAALPPREPIGGRYLLHEQLGAGAIGVVYRGSDRERGGEPVAVKLIDLRAFEAPDDYALQFRRHSRALANLSHPNVVRTLDFGKSGHLLWLVMEHYPSVTLRRFLSERGALEIPLALAIVAETAKALEHIHGFGLIHGDLSPNNILVRLEGERPRIALIDFALVAPDQLLLEASANGIAGTAHYIAPEQTGGVDMGVDGRADLYSLGATFYELVTAERPFTGASLSEILHKHLVERPSPPSSRRKELPASLDAVVLKLLAKDREERYQSASGLLHDLSEVQAALERGEQGPIEIGRQDFRRDLSALNQLYGRQAEGQLLREWLTEAAHGRGGCCFLLGSPGVGKTTLARDIAEQAVKSNGVYLVGKCDPLLQEQPLAPLQAALGTLFRSVLSRQKDQTQRILKRLREQVGEVGQALAALIPEAAQVFPGATEVGALASAEAQNIRLFLALGRVLRAVGEEGRPLLLLLDDAQWADSTTGEFLPYLQRNVSDGHLLVLVTSRSEGGEVAGPLGEAIRFADATRTHGEVLHLEPLDRQTVGLLVSRLVNAHDQELATLTDWIWRRANGNPLFTKEVLRQLIREGAIYASDQGWQLKVNMLEGIRIPPTLTELLVNKLGTLPPELGSLLSTAAVLGKEFSAAALAQLTEMNPDRLTDLIDQATREGLLERAAGGHAFTSDQLRDGAYNRLAAEKRAETHLRIAKMLEPLRRKGSLLDQVEVAHHFIFSLDDERAAEHALLAGEACLKTYANREAVHYFEVARARSKQGLTLAAAERLGDAYAAAGEFAKAVEQHERVLSQLSGALDRARVMDKICNLLDRQGRFHDAARLGNEALKTLGVNSPKSRLGVLIGIVGWLVVALIGGRWPWLLPRFRRKREKRLIVGRHLVRQTHSYFMINMERCTYFHLRALVLLLRLGPCRDLARVMVEHAYVVCTVTRMRGRAKRFAKNAVKMAQSLRDGAMQSYTRVIEAMTYYFIGELDRAFELLNAFNKVNQGVGDLFCQILADIHFGWIHRLRGDLSQARLYADLVLANGQLINDDFSRGVARYMDALVRAAQGDTPAAEEAAQAGLALTAPDPLTHAAAWRSSGVVKLFQGDLSAAAESFRKSMRVAWENSITQEYWVEAISGLAEVAVLQSRTTHPPETAVIGRALRLCRYARWVPLLYPAYGPAAYRVSAMAYADKGDQGRALHFLERAISEGARLGLKLEVARAHQLWADLLPAEDPRRKMYYSLAGATYRRQGAVGLLRSLPPEHQAVDDRSGSGGRSNLDRTQLFGAKSPSSSEGGGVKKSSLTLDRLVQIAQEIGKLDESEKLQREILRVAAEQTGAESGCIFLYNPEEAESDPGLPKGLRRVASYAQGEAAPPVPSTSALEQVLRTRSPVVVGDAQEDLSGARSVMLSKKRSLLCAPMVVGGRLAGLIYLENNLLAQVFSDSDLETLGILSAQGAIALENSSYLSKVRKAHRNEYTLRRLFQSYVPPAVVNELLRRGTESMLKGERRLVTVLFADIRGFTGLSEELEPEQVLAQLNELFAAITGVIHDCHGIIDKFIGDAVMALFGAPHSHGNDALNAVAAGVRIQEAVRDINARNAAAGRRQVVLGIGINSGEAVVGSVGSQQRMEFTAIGDTVNVASRVEATTAVYRSGILITEHTRQHLGQEFALRQLDSIRVKGRNKPVRLFEVWGKSEQLTPDQAALITQFQDGLTAYERAEWNAARLAFEQVIRSRPDDGPAHVLLQRILDQQHRDAG
ncbi:MAG: AAA family ATPase [Myxococcales bacterium]|nr:AAA family ATPase [Myxococcales bacterium]